MILKTGICIDFYGSKVLISRRKLTKNGKYKQEFSIKASVFVKLLKIIKDENRLDFAVKLSDNVVVQSLGKIKGIDIRECYLNNNNETKYSKRKFVQFYIWDLSEIKRIMNNIVEEALFKLKNSIDSDLKKSFKELTK